MKIIPTPRYASFTLTKNQHEYREVLKHTYCDESLKEDILITSPFVGKYTFVKLSSAKLIITKDITVAEKFSKPDEAWFKNRNAAEQGYIITGFADGKIVIYAKNQQGILYALSTLSQIENIEPEFEIKDYPDFRFRGNKWLIWAETEVWSFDLGDGCEALRERVIRKLDVCLKYKVNLLLFDAIGFDTKRFEGYAELMSDLNREARKRNIHLITVGYTMGYGASAHQFAKLMSKVHMNLTSYPDGEAYECLGTFINDPKYGDEPIILARKFGTCLSNDALTALKIEELCNYVRKVQPGGLYLHNMDSYYVDSMLWNSRCDACRNMWPNDDLFAPDGMAGAFAYFFDKINDALKTVRIDDYDSSEDLLIYNISPGYMWYFIPDAEVEKATKFWQAVSKYSKVKKNISPLFRELYYNKKDKKKRVPDIISPALNGKFGVLNFCGSDGFYTDKLFFVSAILNKLFKGAETVLSCSGNYFQEPLQVFNAEYMWNCENSAFYNIDSLPDNYDDLLKLLFDCQKTAFRPEEIYGTGGMLDIICEKLYGKDGAKASEMFKLCGKNYECPVPYTCNKEMHTAGNDVLLPYRWDTLLKKEEIESFLSSFSEMEKLTKEACNILKDCENTDLKSYYRMLTLTLPIVSIWHSYLKLYHQLTAAFDVGTVPENEYLSKIQSLIDQVEAEHRKHLNMNFSTTDIMLGALSKREEMFILMKANLALMKNSVKTGKRIPDGIQNTKSEVWW